jgi:hypothetical protein
VLKRLTESQGEESYLKEIALNQTLMMPTILKKKNTLVISKRLSIPMKSQIFGIKDFKEGTIVTENKLITSELNKTVALVKGKLTIKITSADLSSNSYHHGSGGTAID